MKSRRYLNVGPLHKAQPGEFFDRTVCDYFTEHELGSQPLAKGPLPEFPLTDEILRDLHGVKEPPEPSPIIVFPGPIQSTHDQ